MVLNALSNLIMNLKHYSKVGPNENGEGGIWGASTDEKRVYINKANLNKDNFRKYIFGKFIHKIGV